MLSILEETNTSADNIDLFKNPTQEKRKVRREAEVLRSLIQSAFVVQLVGLYESPLNSVLVTEYLAGGDLITRCSTSGNIVTLQ